MVPWILITGLVISHHDHHGAFSTVHSGTCNAGSFDFTFGVHVLMFRFGRLFLVLYCVKVVPTPLHPAPPGRLRWCSQCSQQTRSFVGGIRAEFGDLQTKLPCRVFLTVAWQDVGSTAPKAKQARAASHAKDLQPRPEKPEKERERERERGGGLETVT